MADLKTDEATVTAVATTVSSAAAGVGFGAALTGSTLDDVGSATVASVLDDVTHQLGRRAALTEQAIDALGGFPLRFSAEIAAVESGLAAGLEVGEPVGGDLVGQGSR